MKKKALLLVLVLALSLCMFGCGGDEPATQAPAGDTQAAAPAPAPAPEQKEIRWVIQSLGATGSGSYIQTERVVDRVNAMAEGRLFMDLMPAGAICGVIDMLDNTNAGTLDAFHGYWGNYLGMIPAAMFWTGLPGHYVDEEAARVWVEAYGADDLFAEIVRESGYDVQAFTTGLVSSEIFAHSKVDIKSVADLKGVKLRGSGLWAQVAAELGAVPVSVAGAEVYTSLERGVVDSIEYGAPGVNLNEGFCDIAKYVVVPGIHQSWVCMALGINDAKWNELSADLKAIVQNACNAQWDWSHALDIKADVQAWKEFKKMEADGKIVINTLSQADKDAMNEITMRLLEEQAANDPLIKKVFDHQNAFMAEYQAYMDDYKVTP